VFGQFVSADGPPFPRESVDRPVPPDLYARALIAAEELAPEPAEVVRRIGPPDTVEGWKALADSLLAEQPCVFHRNLEISSGYAWLYLSMPRYLKWAGMAAFASHHARLVLYPFRLHIDRSGYSDIPRSLRHRSIMLLGDVNTVRTTNNAIFEDIFWVHLVYASTDDGIERLRVLLEDDHHYAAILAAFETIDEGRRVLEDPMASAAARRHATDLIWDGNIRLLEHEQRAVVQPQFDRLSRTFGTLFSAGASLSFEARGLRQELRYFSAFYLYAFGRGLPSTLRARAWPRVTAFDDRWSWIVTAVIPRFRRLDADARSVDESLRRIFHEARHGTAMPCGGDTPPLKVGVGSRLATRAARRRVSRVIAVISPRANRSRM
jgi:hypothetical protein